MPIYEYRCHKCGTFEVTQRITEAPLKKCPTCKGKVERLISHTSFMLKGSGWYATDYAHGSSGTAASSKSESAGGGSESASSGSKNGDASNSKSESAASTTSSSATGDKGSTGKSAD